MPNEFEAAPYDIAHKTRNPLKRSAKLPPSSGESVKPDFLLHHENHFDKNTFVPGQQVSKIEMA